MRGKSHMRATPAELLPQGFEEGAAARPQQSHRGGAAPDLDKVACAQRNLNLAVAGENHIYPLTEDGDLDGGIHANNDRAIGKRVRADGGDREHLSARADNRATCGEG